MEHTDTPPPYPEPPSSTGPTRKTVYLQLGHNARLSSPERLRETYCHKHVLLATAAPGLPTTIHHWKWAEGDELLLSSTPTRCLADSLNLVEGVQELGFCALPPKTADGEDKEDADRVADLVKTLVTEATNQCYERTQRSNLTTASPESDDVITWIQKHRLSPQPRPCPSTTADTSMATTAPVRVFALPVFGRSPSVLVAGQGPHLVWGMLKLTSPQLEGGGWQLELNEYLWHWELGPGWDYYRKYPIRLLVAGATDEMYEGMIKGESRPTGIL